MNTRLRPTIIAMFVAVLGLLLLGVVPTAGANGHKGKICHRTGSSSNPYVVNSPRKGHTSGGHATHPEKGGRTDKAADQDAPKGPTRKSGYSCVEEGGNGACPPGTNDPDCPPPPPPPPPPWPNPPCPPGNGDPVIPPDLAGPAPAIPGQPTVTG